MNKIGEWTEKVKIVKDNLKDSEVVTVDGEVVKLHEKAIENLAMEIVNYAEKLNGTDEESLLREKQKEILRKKEEISNFHNRLIETYGNFYFNFYKRIDIENQYLFRFIYLCSYMNYDNYLSNGKRLLRVNDLEGLLGLSEREFYRTKKSLIDSNLITIKDKNLVYINDKYCKKGEIHRNKNIEFIRMFNEAIKELYEKSTPREHKKLALLIKLLPYINYKYNIICSNPEEENIQLINPIKMSDLCEMLGYDRTNASKLKRQLFALRVNDEKVIGIFEVEDSKAILVNPRVYYKGNQEDGLNYLEALFRL